jgi:iron complex outermembrane receptor protein
VKDTFEKTSQPILKSKQTITMKILSIPIILASSVALAQDKANKEQVSELEALTIESTPLGTSVNETSQAWSVLSGNELEKSKSGTIAESLSNVPGVSQSFFGPSANRPIIRGLDKNRVRMLQNGIDTFDVSAQSEDHAIPVDPMFIERIEILRGSSALLHGGSAIGGVVNVIDRSIPTSPYTSPGASLRSSYTSVNDGWNYGAMAFGGSETLSFQINGFKREYEDYDSPIGKIANSHGESSSIGLGGSHIWESGYAGLSFSSYENTYGVPGEHAELDTRIELESDRFEVRSEIEVSGSDWLTGIDLSFGFGDYKHSEIGKHHEEDDDDHDGGDAHDDEDHEDELHTHAIYFREGIESKIGFKHEIGSMKGSFGFHGLFDELSIAGDESIFSGDTNSSNAVTSDKINNEEAQKLSLFLIEEFELSESTLINGGIRWEGIDREFATFKHDDNTTGSRELDDSSFSASFGVSHKLNEIWSLSSNLTYSERVPDSSELFAFGPHHATEAFEIGDSSLDKESAVGIEVILRRTMGKFTGQLSAFHTEFDNYVFLEHGEAPVGVDTDGLGVLEYHSAKAEFQGLEAELDWLALENEGWSLLLSSYGDLLRGKNKSENANLPRIAPARIGVGFEIQADKFRFGMNLDHVFKQNRISVHEEEEEDDGDDDHDDHEHGETATAAYSLLNAYAAYDLNIGKAEGELFVRGYNLTDELARVHTSFLKSSAPLPGANVEIGLKFDF